MRAGGPRSQVSTRGCSGCAGARSYRFASQETIAPTPLASHTSRPVAGVPRNPARVQRRGMWQIVRRVGCGPEDGAPRDPPAVAPGARGREAIGSHLRRPSPLRPLRASPPDRSLAFPATPLACRDEKCGRSCAGSDAGRRPALPGVPPTHACHCIGR